jgi:hypothetical protein
MPQQRTDHIARLPLFNLPRTWNRLYTELSDTQVKHIFSKAVLQLLSGKTYLCANLQ